MPRRSRHQQVRPNRRFARKLPVALAGIALALPGIAGPASARADTHRAAHAGPPPQGENLVGSRTPARRVRNVG
jgi:hypothetical protein